MAALSPVNPATPGPESPVAEEAKVAASVPVQILSQEALSQLTTPEAMEAAIRDIVAAHKWDSSYRVPDSLASKTTAQFVIALIKDPNQIKRFTAEQRKHMTVSQLQQLPKNQQKAALLEMIPNGPKPADYKVPNNWIEEAAEAEKVLFQWLSEDQLTLVPDDMAKYIPEALVAKVTKAEHIASFTEAQMKHIVEAQVPHVSVEKVKWIPNELVVKVEDPEKIAGLAGVQYFYMSEAQLQAMKPQRQLEALKWVGEQEEKVSFSKSPLPVVYTMTVSSDLLDLATKEDFAVLRLVSEEQMQKLDPERQATAFTVRAFCPHVNPVSTPDVVLQNLQEPTDADSRIISDFALANMTPNQVSLVPENVRMYIPKELVPKITDKAQLELLPKTLLAYITPEQFLKLSWQKAAEALHNLYYNESGLRSDKWTEDFVFSDEVIKTAAFWAQISQNDFWQPFYGLALSYREGIQSKDHIGNVMSHIKPSQIQLVPDAFAELLPEESNFSATQRAFLARRRVDATPRKAEVPKLQTPQRAAQSPAPHPVSPAKRMQPAQEPVSKQLSFGQKCEKAVRQWWSWACKQFSSLWDRFLAFFHK